MPKKTKPKIKGKIKKLPTDTDVIMPGYKYPKGFMKQMEAQRKKSKKKQVLMKKPTKGSQSRKKPAPQLGKKLKDPRLSGPGAAKRMKEKLGYR